MQLINFCNFSRELANKVLVTGKSINFLREVCQDKTSIKGKEDLKQCFETNRKLVLFFVRFVFCLHYSRNLMKQILDASRSETISN